MKKAKLSEKKAYLFHSRSQACIEALTLGMCKLHHRYAYYSRMRAELITVETSFTCTLHRTLCLLDVALVVVDDYP